MTMGSNARNFASTWAELGRSSLLAWARPVGLAMVASTSLSCLVTEHIRFDEANVPALLTPITPVEFSRVKPESDPACTEADQDRGTSNVAKMAFEVHVADVNVEDALFSRIVINTRDLAARAPIPGGNGKVDRGTVRMCIDHAKLTARCNHVVFAVSRRFQDSDDWLAVEEPGDLATVSFFVLGKAEDNAGAEPEDCARLFSDAGLP